MPVSAGCAGPGRATRVERNSAPRNLGRTQQRAAQPGSNATARRATWVERNKGHADTPSSGGECCVQRYLRAGSLRSALLARRVVAVSGTCAWACTSARIRRFVGLTQACRSPGLPAARSGPGAEGRTSPLGFCSAGEGAGEEQVGRGSAGPRQVGRHQALAPGGSLTSKHGRRGGKSAAAYVWLDVEEGLCLRAALAMGLAGELGCRPLSARLCRFFGLDRPPWPPELPAAREGLRAAAGVLVWGLATPEPPCSRRTRPRRHRRPSAPLSADCAGLGARNAGRTQRRAAQRGSNATARRCVPSSGVRVDGVLRVR